MFANDLAPLISIKLSPCVNYIFDYFSTFSIILSSTK